MRHANCSTELSGINRFFCGGAFSAFPVIIRSWHDLCTVIFHTTTALRHSLNGGLSPASAVLTDNYSTFTPGISEMNALGTRFYLADASGHSRGLLNSSGAATDGYNWEAFGTLVSRFGNDPTGFAWNVDSGYQADNDDGLALLGHRYYDKRTGRFLSQDPAGSGNNWYAYAGNNPTNKIDPSGLIIQDGPGASMLGSPGAMANGNGGNGFGEDDYESYDNNQRVTQNRIDHALGELRAGTTQLGESSTTTEAGIEELMELAKEGDVIDESTLKAAYKGIQDWAEARGIPIRPTSDNHVGERIFERFNSLKDFRNVWNTGRGYAISTYENQFALYSSTLKMAIIWDGTAKQVFAVYSRQNTNGWIPVGRGFLP